MEHLRSLALSACVASLSLAGCGGASHPGAAPAEGAALPAAGSMDRALRRPGSDTFNEYPILPNGKHDVKSFPVGIVTAKDGTIWFAVRGWGEADSITKAGVITHHSLKKKGQGPSFRPQNLVVDADGNIWATSGTNRTYRQESDFVPDPYGSIREMTPSGKVVNVFQIPTMDSDPRGIVIAPNGDRWFTEVRGAIGYISGDAPPVEIASQGNNPVYSIIVGPDQNIWYSETFSDTICQITLPYTPSESPTCFPLPKGAGPSGMVSGPDGYIYFSEFINGKVAQMTTSGTLTAEVTLHKNASPKGITFGSDGNLYVAEFGIGAIARISMSGSGFTSGDSVTEMPIPTPKSGPWIITSGPDNNIWFTESLKGQIGKLTI